jgi:hypothetical protein
VIRLWAARAAGLVAGLGLLSIASSGNRWATGGVSISGKYFLITLGVLLVAWVAARRWIRGPDGSSTAIWRTFVQVACATAALLAAYSAAISNFIDLKDMGYRTQMVAELMTLRDAEEAIRARTGAYARELLRSDFEPTSGVGPLEITLTADGWTAFVAHRGLPTITCVIYVGSTPRAPATNAGEPACRGRMPIDRGGLMLGLAMIATGVLVVGLMLNRSSPAVAPS